MSPASEGRARASFPDAGGGALSLAFPSGASELALFAGAGGGLLASRILGWDTIGAVERDDYAAEVLVARQRDGSLPTFPVWRDVRDFDGRPWRGAIDVISGGFPCQDVSSAATTIGTRQGTHGVQSGLAWEMLRIVAEVRPPWVFTENSRYLLQRGLAPVARALAALGYRVAWRVLGAAACGAPHDRERLWLVAHADDASERTFAVYAPVAGKPPPAGFPRGAGRIDCPWRDLPDLSGMDASVADWMERTRATGNGQVPVVAAIAFRSLAAALLGVECDL